MNGILVTVGCALAFSMASVPDDPALAGLSPPERRMLDPIRERSLKPEALLDALALKGDERIADVGAGPGFFTLKLARRVPKGHVLATDIDAAALTVLTQRAMAAGLTNVETVKVTPDDPGLAPASIDLAFVCQVDHYLKDRVAYFKALRTALKPHGRLVLVNMGRYQDADRAAALAAGFATIRDAAAPPGHFVLICETGTVPSESVPR